MSIKIFQMNDCDWYAGETVEDVIRQFKDDVGYDDDDWKLWGEEPRELAEHEMDMLKFYPDFPDNKTHSISFRQQLNLLIQDNAPFPILFASTEY